MIRPGGENSRMRTKQRFLYVLYVSAKGGRPLAKLLITLNHIMVILFFFGIGIICKVYVPRVIVGQNGTKKIGAFHQRLM